MKKNKSTAFSVGAISAMILVVAFVFFNSQFAPIQTHAAGSVYYVDSISGNDANPGTAEDAPWQTLNSVNSRTFTGGDTILFRKGSEWRGGIDLKTSGNESVPVTLSSYGVSSSTAPIFNGAQPASATWAQDSNNPNIYSGIQAQNSVKQVIVDGNRLDPARTPNTGYFKIDQVVSSTSFISSSATSIFTASGIGKTTIYFRSATWRVDKRIVTAFDPVTNIVTFNSPLPYALTAGWGFYLMNDRSFIDQPGEWFYDDITKELSVWLRSSDSPTTHIVELSTTPKGVYSGNKLATVIVENLEFQNFAENAIRLVNSSSTIRGNVISRSLERGMQLSSKNIRIENNLISDSYQGGIGIYRADYVDTLVIQSNTLNNNGSLGNQANPGQQLDGITMFNVKVATITDNVIRNSGYAGIIMSYENVNTAQDSIVISSNTIENFCLYLNDCGGIYLNGANFSPTLRSEVGFNTVINGVGDNGGTLYGNNPYPIIVSGIYLDWYASNVNVHHNTINRTVGDGGVKINGGNNNTIDSNVIYQYSTWPTIYFLKRPDSRFNPPTIYPMSGNVTSNNQFFVEKIFNNTQDMVFRNTADSDNNFGTFTNNTINSDLTTAITAPQGNATVFGTVTINANTSSTKSTVSKVEFYVDGGLKTTDLTSPYSALWDTTPLVHNSSHALLAKVHDTVGNMASSSVISVIVSDVTLPTVSITSPLNNATVARNKTITINAAASDVSGISKVEFYVNSTLKCTDTTASYFCAWRVPTQKNITYTLQAKAYDSAGNTSTHSISVKSF